MATKPLSDLTATWNAAGTTFTAVKMNVTDTASAAGSLLLDLQVGGTSQFMVSKGGRVTAQTLTIGLGGATAVATNTALGFEALNSASLTGAVNTGIGYQALKANTTGSDNVAVGAISLLINTTGSFNIAVGRGTLANNNGDNNIAINRDALNSNTTGAQNVAIGRVALFSNVAGSDNVAVGHTAMQYFNTSQNIAIGRNALRGGSTTVADNTGAGNVAVGHQAGDNITSGSNNVVIGNNLDADSATASNQININARYFHDRIRLLERAADPAKPTEGNMIVWMSDGTGLGDDGDVIIASTAGGVTNYAILFDHSGGTLWP